MILYKGEILDNSKQDALIDSLYEDCLSTLQNAPTLDYKIVIDACDKLYKRVINREFDDIVLPLLKMVDISYAYFLTMATMFSKEGLSKKMEIELGKDFDHLEDLSSGSKRYIAPLGILFHIAAGNVDVLPAYSVIEGLLSGNINILKLPSGDSGMSIKLLSELIKEAPLLKEYIYVFDVPSTEIDSIKKLAKIADGIVVWGGDVAIDAARKMADINSKIISWGHKLSFAYVGECANEEDLHGLAHSICVSNQLLCSSCQGIFYYDPSTIEDFAKKFFDILKIESNKLGNIDIGMAGRNSILSYAASLEEGNEDIVFNGDGVSVILKKDNELELSNMFRSVWVKPLPEENIIKALKKHKNHLQSVALICQETDRPRLASLLSKAGLVRICRDNPSRMFLGEAHDGYYALKEYTKVVEVD